MYKAVQLATKRTVALKVLLEGPYASAKRRHRFEREIDMVNATNIALNVLDENVLARAVEAINKDFADQPLVQASLQQTVADTYAGIGLHESAMPLQEASLRTSRRVLGDNHPDTLDVINNMAILLRVMGKYEEALPYNREALEGSRRVLGNNHLSTLASIGNMGMLFLLNGEHTKAEPLLRETLVSNRRVLGDDHPDTLTAMNNMGSLLETIGDYEEAISYYREALEASRRRSRSGYLQDNHIGCYS